MPARTRLARSILLSLALAAACVPGTASAVEQCAPKPRSPDAEWLDAVGATRVTPPAATPPIAVLDSGVSPVPELEGRLRPGADMSGGGRTTDADGHGTAVAAIAAAAAGGMRGVSPTSPIIPIKIFDDEGATSAAWVAGAVRRAVALGAAVINISAAGPLGQDPAGDRLVQNAIFDAVSKGIVVVAPSGNEGARHLDIPAAYPHVLAVGATDESLGPASFSNSGPGLDVVAPGENLIAAAPATLCPSGYALVSGTSFAAPAVAGAAALIKAAQPKLDATQVIDLLRLRGDRAPAPPWGPDLGFGLLDIPASLSGQVPAADAHEVDDSIAWARPHAAILTPRRRTVAVNARVETHTDPADVFRIKLKRGDRLTARLVAAAGSLRLSLSDGRQTLKDGLRFSVKVTHTGTYYAKVAGKSTPPAGADYRLTLKR